MTAMIYSIDVYIVKEYVDSLNHRMDVDKDINENIFSTLTKKNNYFKHFYIDFGF